MAIYWAFSLLAGNGITALILNQKGKTTEKGRERNERKWLALQS